MTTASLLRAAVAVGRELAAEVQLPIRIAFADGVAGDVMRFRVLRRLRKTFARHQRRDPGAAHPMTVWSHERWRKQLVREPRE